MTEPRMTLADAMAGAQAAGPGSRIEWRDRLAEHGPAAIDAVFEWLGDAQLGAFAVRVIEAVGRRGHREEAVQALLTVGSIGASATVRADAQDAIERLVPTKAGRTPRRGPVEIAPNAGWSWPGFEAEDFGNVVGRWWRRRNDPASLVPLLLRPLKQRNSAFSSYPIYQVPEVHLADRDRYEQGGEHEQGWRASKLVVYANAGDDGAALTGHVAVGLYIEKGTGTGKFGPVDRALWDWPRFTELLVDPRRRQALADAMTKHPLTIGDYMSGRFRPGAARMGFTARIEGEALVLRDSGGEQVGIGWEALADRVTALPADAWHDLHVWREWPAEQAIAAGQPFAARELEPVLLALAEVYLDIIGMPRS